MDNKFILIVLIAITLVLLIWLIYTLVIFSNNKLYCKHFLKKEWNLWEKILEELKKQRGTIYVSKFDDFPKADCFRINIEINSKEYELFYWVKRETASVYQGENCVLCSYDKYHSNMAVKVMREKIKREFDNADEETKQMTKELIGEW